MGCELVQADLAYGLSRLGSRNSRLSSRLSFIGWDDFKALFCVVSGNSHRSEFSCFLHNRNFDFRLVLATIRHLAIFAILVFILSAPAAYFVFTSYSDIVFMLLLWVLLWLALSPSRLRGHGNLIAQSLILLVLPWIRLTGYALASWLLDRKISSLGGLRFPRSVAGIQSDDGGQPILFSTCAGVICNAGREFLPRPVCQFGAAILK